MVGQISGLVEPVTHLHVLQAGC